MLKLESEIAEIKNMLKIQQHQQKSDASEGESNAIAGIAAFDQMYGQDMNDGRQGVDPLAAIENMRDKEELKRYIQQQKVIIKKAQEKLALCKQQYKQDKRRIDADDSVDHEEAQRQKQALEQVKAQIEERVNKINSKVDKIKALEKKMQAR